eukprot:gene1439-1814_t
MEYQVSTPTLSYQNSSLEGSINGDDGGGGSSSSDGDVNDVNMLNSNDNDVTVPSILMQQEMISKLKKKFEDAVIYFDQLVDTVIGEEGAILHTGGSTGVAGSTTSSHHHSRKNTSVEISSIFHSNNNNTILIDGKNAGRKRSEVLNDSEDLNHNSWENAKIQLLKSDLHSAFMKKSYEKREEMYLTLSNIENQLVFDKVLAHSFNSFVNDCYNDSIKLMRNSPDVVFGNIGGNFNDDVKITAIRRQNVEVPFNFPDFIKRKIARITLYSLYQFLLTMIPIHVWVKGFKLSYLKDDLISSVTVGFMIIPQAMAYAILAGLPPIYGLYAAFTCPIIYGIFGTSNEISVGPVAMVSLLVPSIIGLSFDDPNYVVDSICLSLLSGLILLVIGLMQAGFIIENLLSNPILLGFIQSSSILIMCSQLKGITAIPISSHSKTIIEFLSSIAENYRSIHGYTVLMGFLSLSKHNIKIIDEIPSGLPAPKWVPLTIDRIGNLFVGAVIISILGFVESISIAKKFSSIRKYSINPSQELVALGMCNIIGSIFQACPVTGSFSRTAVNFQTGSKSRLCSLATGVIVGCVLLFLTPVFKHTPICILSAIVIAAALSLFEVKESIGLFKKGELLGFIQMVFVFCLTLFLGSEIGIVVAFCVSILQIIYFSARPHLVKLGRLPGTLVYRNVNHYPEAITHNHILVVRYDSRLTYYTINHFRDQLYKIDLFPPDREDISTIVFDSVNISSIDSTAIDVLNEMLDFYESNGIHILWSDIRSSIRRRMFQSGFLKRIKEEHIFSSTHKAVEYALSNYTTKLKKIVNEFDMV